MRAFVVEMQVAAIDCSDGVMTRCRTANGMRQRTFLKDLGWALAELPAFQLPGNTIDKHRHNPPPLIVAEAHDRVSNFKRHLFSLVQKSTEAS